MDVKKYAIKKDKLDLLSSLKSLDKKVLKECFDDFEVDNINDLKKM